jgi:peroxiredoxin Q/BCP
MAQTLKEGDKAPGFRMPTDGGGTIDVEDLKGSVAVLYFYPKDNTSGCTSEALAFSAQAKAFAKLGARVIGVSKDDPASHDKFKKKHRLAVALASDMQGVAERYGVWVKKSMYGRSYMGIERATFLIDEKGLIRRIWRKVKVPGHAQEVLEAVKALRAGAAKAGPA